MASNDADPSDHPGKLFKTLRHMHGRKLDSGLNDLTEAFAAFMTRAKYFSVGHLRRTWSHSAVEFMKYRRRLPTILAGDADPNDQGNEESFATAFSAISAEGQSRRGSLAPASTSFVGEANDAIEDLKSRRLCVANVPARVTLAQLASFFSKFGRVVSCSFSIDNQTATLPRRGKGTAYVTFQSKDDVEKALNASLIELIFYNQAMTVSAPPSPPQRNILAQQTDFLGRQYSGDSGGSSDRCETINDVDDWSMGSVNYSGRSFFNMAPENVLSQILAHLDIFDRIRLERVCKRWQEASFKSWSFTKRIWLGSDFSSTCNKRALNNNTLRAILHRAGPHLVLLNLSGAADSLNDYSLSIIAENCVLLRHIDLTGLKAHWTSLKVFAEICGARLNSITYRKAPYLGDNAFWWLLRPCSSLNSIDFGRCPKLTGKCFRALNSNVTSLQLNRCQNLETSALQEICLKCYNLRYLNLDHYVALDDPTLSAICRSLPQLERLSLRFTPFTREGSVDDVTTLANSLRFTSSGLKQLGRLENLTVLSLDNNPMVDDAVLEAVCKPGGTLHTLSICGAGVAGSITREGLSKSLCNPKLNLLDLNLSHLSRPASVEFLIDLTQTIGSNLIRLVLRACDQINDEVVLFLARDCAHLKNLDLSDCRLITDRSIKEFFYTSRNFSSTFMGDRLVLNLNGTSCDELALNIALQSSQNFDRITLNFEPTIKPEILEPEIFGNTLDDDEVGSDEEFDALMAQKSYIMDRLDEDDLMPENVDAALANIV